MSYMQEQNTVENAGRYRTKKLSAILPEMQTRNADKCKTTENSKRARRKDAEPINRAISRDLLAHFVLSINEV